MLIMKSKKEIRKQFRNAVFKRDRYTCKVCGANKEESALDAHHITDRNAIINGGYVASNGITVCKGQCHLIVENFHINGGKSWIDGFHPDDLYRMINSSKEQAVKDSERLP